MKINGAVDWFKEPNIFFGWAKAASDNAVAIRVVAKLNNEILGSCEANLVRPGPNQDPIGFQCHLQGTFSPFDLLTGALKFEAETQDSPSFALPVYVGLRKEISAIFVRDQIKDATPSDAARILRRISSAAATGPMKRLNDVIGYIESDPSELTLFDRSKAPELSMFGVLVGTLSPSKAIVVGRDGHLFLEGGSNSLSQQYKTDINDPIVVSVAEKWNSLIRRRLETLSYRGIKFCQIIIPEKSTVLSEFFPISISAPTPFLKAVQSKISQDESLSRVTFDALKCLISDRNRENTYRKHDSHLTAYGSQQVFSEFLRFIGYDVDLNYTFDQKSFNSGDMGLHFPGMKFGMYDDLPNPADFESEEAGLELVDSYFPGGGKHIGRYRIWKNDRARIQKKVVVFGNSFFEMGTSALCLSWWFARWFSEFHFRWEPDLDYEYIEKTNPDIVICQTIERFMPKVPKD